MPREMKQSLLAVVLIVSHLFVGCGDTPRIEDFIASPTDLPPGGGVISIRWRVSGATNVEITHLGSVLPSEGERTIAIDRTTNFTLAAASREGSAELRTITVNVGQALQSVHGRVVDHSGRPVGGANVVIGSSVNVTDADGRFYADSVLFPYSALVRHGAGTRTYGFADLSHAAPILVVSAPSLPAASRETFLRGRALAHKDAVPSSETLTTVWISTASNAVFAFREEKELIFDKRVEWDGDTSTHAEVVAYRMAYYPDVGRSDLLEWGAVRNVELQSGEPVDDIAIELGDFPTRTILGSIDFPDWVGAASAGFVMSLPGRAPIRETVTSTSNGTFQFMVPDFPDAEYFVDVFGVQSLPMKGCGGCTGSVSVMVPAPAVNGDTVEVFIPDLPDGRPVDGAIISQDAEFAWTPPKSSVCLAEISVGQGSSSRSFQFLTSDGFVDVDGLGERLPTGPGSWSLTCFLGFHSATDAVADERFGRSVARLVPHTIVRVNPRKFVIQ